jgi:signal transduction histidine kinase
MSFIGFLKEDILTNDLSTVTDSLQRLEKAHRRMQELINDLLQVSRIGRMELHYEKLAIKEVLDEVIENAMESIHTTKARFEFASDMPVIWADRKRLVQVLENLIGNAIKYTSDTANPLVHVLWNDAPTEIQLCLKDNGPGIESQYHAKIFGLFQRLDSSKEGTGVGLTIVSRIMQLHGGRVWVNSQLGQGAEFWLAFPKVPNRKGL